MKYLPHLVLASLLACAQFSRAAIYRDTTPGVAVNDGTIAGGEYAGFSTGINSGFGDQMGATSQLHVDSGSGGELAFGIVAGAAGGLFNQGVIYIDSVTGGFSGTQNFTDYPNDDDLRQAISGNGYTGDGSELTFAPGFLADYAIGFDGGFGGLWQLRENDSHLWITSVQVTTATLGHYEMNLLLSNIGLSVGDSFDYFATYGNADDTSTADSFFRSDEFHGVTSFAGGNPGTTDAVLGAGDFNTFVSIPEPSTALMMLAGLTVLGSRLRRRNR